MLLAWLAARFARVTDGNRSDIVSIAMKPLIKRGLLILWCCSGLLLLNGCEASEPECTSVYARTSVIKIVSDDSHNRLIDFALKNASSVAAMISNTKVEAEKRAVYERARQGATYELDDTIITNSGSRVTRAISCSGLLSVTVGDTTAQKQVDFRIDWATDGKMSVSVNPFLF
jgi:hypothetical protein